jgi:hypothetical protein
MASMHVYDKPLQTHFGAGGDQSSFGIMMNPPFEKMKILACSSLVSSA